MRDRAPDNHDSTERSSTDFAQGDYRIVYSTEDERLIVWVVRPVTGETPAAGSSGCARHSRGAGCHQARANRRASVT